MLRKLRIAVAVVMLSLVTFYFIDFAGLLPEGFSVLEHIQFVPAVLSLSTAVLVALVALTLLLGRLYCSVICPMGIFQDVIARISRGLGKKPKKKKRYQYSPGPQHPALHPAGSYGRRTGIRIYPVGQPARPVRRLRPYRRQRIRSGLSGGQQPARGALHRNGQLHVLPDGHLRAQRLCPVHRPAYLARGRVPGLEARPHVLQHHLPGRDVFRADQSFFLVENPDRPCEMHPLRGVRHPVQSLVHRQPEPAHRLQPLRGLLRLPGCLPAGCALFLGSQESAGASI